MRSERVNGYVKMLTSFENYKAAAASVASYEGVSSYDDDARAVEAYELYALEEDDDDDQLAEPEEFGDNREKLRKRPR